MSPSYVAKSEVELVSATWQTSVSSRMIIMHELTAKTKKEDVPTKPNVRSPHHRALPFCISRSHSNP